MAITAEDFLGERPEFKTCPVEIIEAELASAASQIVAMDLFEGDMVDVATSLRAAHLIAISPFGRSSRLVTENGMTTYQAQFDRIWLTALAGV